MDPFYRTTFSKALHNAVVNGFWSRYLDADDHEFLEYVSKCGVANGSLPSREAVLIEELEFWHLPYSLAPGIERRVGKRPRPEESGEARALRQARSSAWHARRIIKEQERKIAEAEMAREQAEWKQANERRKRQQIISDLEWDAAMPRRSKFGATVDRHYIPQWKLDEEGIKPVIEKKTRLPVLDSAAETRRQQAAAQSMIDEARKTVEHAAQMERDAMAAREEMLDADRAATLKPAIMTMLKRTAPTPWNGYDLMRAVGCTDEQLMIRCMRELQQEGQLRDLGKEVTA